MARKKAEEYPQGAAVLDSVESLLRRFVHFPTDAGYTITALWVAGTHMVTPENIMVHQAYGRLGFVSDEPGSGKTTAMERALELCPRGEVLVQSSLAGLLDAMEEKKVLGIDEADKYFGRTGGRMEHVVAFLNAGYKRGASVRHARRQVNTYSAVAYTGLLESLGVNPSLAPLRTRSFLVEMHPAPKGTEIAEFDDERHDGLQAMTRDAVASWAASVSHLIPAIVVTDPDDVSNRRAQIWRPLFRVAMLAGAGWLEKALTACRELESGISAEQVVLTPEQRIMPDVMAACGGEIRIPTTELIKRLHDLPDSPWKFVLPDVTSPAAGRDLAALLAPHGLESTTVRITTVAGVLTFRGYDLSMHKVCKLCPEVTG